ncbi:hypothetical protein ACSBPQ_04900 [Stenotrophomonas sp. JC08]|uniref:hypothetical protein n=1 Tax=Stenotrophomonas sp. JC08 TaxID=3445779 RepID=UPI003FA296CF
MAEFLEVALSYPTLPYSVVLCFAVIYWMLAATGIIDEGGIGSGDGADFHSGADGASGLAGMFARMGLGGAPTMLVVLLLAFFGWSITYLVQLFFLQPLPALLRWGIGTGVAFAALIPGAIVSSWVLRPIRRFLMKLRAVPQENILGKVGQVSSPEVTAGHGYASIDDGGAGLILQVRAQPGSRFERGERVRLVRYLPQHNHYLVVGEADLPTLDIPISQVSVGKEKH